MLDCVVACCTSPYMTSCLWQHTPHFTLLSFRLNNPSWRRGVIATVEYPHNWICVVFPETSSSKCFPLFIQRLLARANSKYKKESTNEPRLECLHLKQEKISLFLVYQRIRGSLAGKRHKLLCLFTTYVDKYFFFIKK